MVPALVAQLEQPAAGPGADLAAPARRDGEAQPEPAVVAKPRGVAALLVLLGLGDELVAHAELRVRREAVAPEAQPGVAQPGVDAELVVALGEAGVRGRRARDRDRGLQVAGQLHAVGHGGAIGEQGAVEGHPPQQEAAAEAMGRPGREEAALLDAPLRRVPCERGAGQRVEAVGLDDDPGASDLSAGEEVDPVAAGLERHPQRGALARRELSHHALAVLRQHEQLPARAGGEAQAGAKGPGGGQDDVAAPRQLEVVHRVLTAADVRRGVGHRSGVGVAVGLCEGDLVVSRVVAGAPQRRDEVVGEGRAADLL